MIIIIIHNNNDDDDDDDETLIQPYDQVLAKRPYLVLISKMSFRGPSCSSRR